MRHVVASTGIIAGVLAGCAIQSAPPARAPAEVRADIAARMPSGIADRAGWAADIQTAFDSLTLPASEENICAVIAVTEQESGFQVDPAVPQLPKIAWAEIDRRAERLGVPALLVRAALHVSSPNGKTYAERIDAARTERDLSEVFDDLIGIVPMGRRLFGGLNPVRTAGPMQVGIAFAERQAADHTYPYHREGSVRSEVFTRRGGMYFGIAHLLDYPADYDALIYRFADYNAGRYASRNAAFQNALSRAAGMPLALDGDLVNPDAPEDKAGSTERAVRALAGRLGMDDHEIHRALGQGESADFSKGTLYRRVFALADAKAGSAMPRAMLPEITLHSPKITRRLTTAWFANRVDGRYKRCLSADGRRR